MSQDEKTFQTFADELKLPVKTVIQHVQKALNKQFKPNDVMDTAVQQVIDDLQQDTSRKTVTLKKRNIMVKGSSGTQRELSITVKRKRSFTRPVVEDLAAESSAADVNEDDVSATDQQGKSLENDAEGEKEQTVTVDDSLVNVGITEQTDDTKSSAQSSTSRRDEQKEYSAENVASPATDKTTRSGKDKLRTSGGRGVLSRDAEGDKVRGKRQQGGRDADMGGRGKVRVLNIKDALQGQERATRRRRRTNKKMAKSTAHAFSKPQETIVHEVSVGEYITVARLAQKMAVKATEVVKALMKNGVMANINESIEQDVAVLIVEEMGHKVKIKEENRLENDLQRWREAKLHATEKKPRAPVVTIMGHVDHGKTSLLDAIRSTKVTAGEAGGITQHIGAYMVDTPRGPIAFLDTPGHAAFTAMRARGALCTDLVVLVVAADDGVKPQTLEAITHAKAADVPIVVAVNKIDKPEADIDRVKSELSAHDVIAEDWGGEVIFVPVSAKKGEGIDALLESIVLQAEVLELKAIAEGPAHGVVIEARLDKGRGPVATVLVQEGKLQPGQILLVGHEFGRVRAMFNEDGVQVYQVKPSMPVEILGLSGVAKAGEEAFVVESEVVARGLAQERQVQDRQKRLHQTKKQGLDDLFSQSAENIPTLNILLKADVQGSVEALSEALQKLTTEEVAVRIIGSGVGGINESDAQLAVASKAMLIGFNVRSDALARKIIEEEELKIQYAGVIYDALDIVKQLLSGMLSPLVKEEIIGLAEVRNVFRSSKFGAIAGCMVVEGVVKRNAPARVLRDNVVIHEGELNSLRRFKEDAQKVQHGMECGIGIKDYQDIREKDNIEIFERTEVARQLD